MAAEQLAQADQVKQTQPIEPTWRAYVPVIVTNAELAVCSFDARSISLETGEVGEPALRPVECVRFRKSFSLVEPAHSGRRGLDALAQDSERTVFVVRATSLVQFLSALGGIFEQDLAEGME